MPTRFSDMEDAYIVANAGVLIDEQVAANLTSITGRHISLSTVRQRRRKLGLRKKHGHGVCELEDGLIGGPRGVPLHLTGRG